MARQAFAEAEAGRLPADQALRTTFIYSDAAFIAGNYEESLAGARWALSQTLSPSDRLIAEVLAARAEFTLDPRRQTQRRLEQTAEAAAEDPAAWLYAFEGLAELARYAQERRRFLEAVELWADAAEFLDHSNPDASYYIMRAALGEGIARVSWGWDEFVSESSTLAISRGAIDPVSRIYRGQPLLDNAFRASAAMTDWAYQQHGPDSGVAAELECIHAAASAWLNFSLMFAASPEAEDNVLGISAHYSRSPGAICGYRASSEPRLELVREDVNRLEAGVVVMRFAIGEAGEVTGARVIGSAPNDSFAATVADPSLRWRLTPLETNEPGCAEPYMALIPVPYYFAWRSGVALNRMPAGMEVNSPQGTAPWWQGP